MPVNVRTIGVELTFRDAVGDQIEFVGERQEIAVFVLDGLNNEVKQRTATIVSFGRVKLADDALTEREGECEGELPWVGN